MSADWTSPEDLRVHVERLWYSGRLLTDETLFPLELKVRRPGSRALSERFDEVRLWIRALESEPAFQIEWAEVDHRVLGRNQVPIRVIVANRNDALRLIGRVEEAERIRSLAAATALRLPGLNDWLARKPLVALENTADWDRILDVLDWFRANPRCGLYLRQLDIAGVDSKFIEARKPLLAELLDVLLTPVECPRGPRWFEQRYGLATKPLQVRFRVLDRRLAVCGLTDLAVIVNEMAALNLQARCVFITENEVNGLAFPEVPDSIVIFGLGYGVEILSGIPWLAERDLRYWGDIDTYGFHILDRLRATFPHAQSFLMDRSTLLAHEVLWVREENPYKGELVRLTESERAVYEGLQGVRLEQERIRYGWLLDALTRALPSDTGA
jgi:hypothetical protein